MKTIKLLGLMMIFLAVGCQQAKSKEDSLTEIHADSAHTIPLDGHPSNILYYRGRLYVDSLQDQRLWALDPVTGKELMRFEDFDSYISRPDGGVAVRQEEERRACPDDMVIAGGKLFVEQIFCDSLLVLDAETLQPLTRIEVGASGHMVASPDEKNLYFARNDASGFCIIDTDTYEKKDVAYPMCDIVKEGSAYPAGGHGIGALSISPDGKQLYLGISRGARDAGVDPPSETAGPVNPLTQTHPGPFLAVYDLERRDYIALKSVGDTLKARDDDISIPHAFAFSRDAGTLYIAMRQCTVSVHVFDTRTNELREPITFEASYDPLPWQSCADIAVWNGKIYVSLDSDSEIMVIDAESYREPRVSSLGTYGRYPLGRMAFVGNRLFVCRGMACLAFDINTSPDDTPQ